MTVYGARRRRGRVPLGVVLALLLADTAFAAARHLLGDTTRNAGGYAGKTGSDSAAGGCLAFFTRVTVGGRRMTAVGVVLGQGQGSDTSELLAAGQAAEQLVDSVAPMVRGSAIAAPGGAGGRGPDARGHERPRRLASGHRSAQN
jgi:hypothetical protein